MDISENETRFDPLIGLNHPLHKGKRSQLSMGAWLNQESVKRVLNTLLVEICLLCKTFHITQILKKVIVTIFSLFKVIDQITQFFYFFNIMGFDRIGESIKVDCKIICMVSRLVKN